MPEITPLPGLEGANLPSNLEVVRVPGKGSKAACEMQHCGILQLASRR